MSADAIEQLREMIDTIETQGATSATPSSQAAEPREFAQPLEPEVLATDTQPDELSAQPAEPAELSDKPAQPQRSKAKDRGDSSPSNPPKLRRLATLLASLQEEARSSQPAPATPPQAAQPSGLHALYSPITAKLLRQAMDTSPVPAKKAETKALQAQARAGGKSSQAKAKAKAKDKGSQAKKTPTMEDTAARGVMSKEPKADYVSKDFGRLFITKASMQSYIQFRDGEGRKRLLVAVTAHTSLEHQNIIMKLAEWVGKRTGLTKDKVLEAKQSMLAS